MKGANNLKNIDIVKKAIKLKEIDQEIEAITKQE